MLIRKTEDRQKQSYNEEKLWILETNMDDCTGRPLALSWNV